MNGFAVLPDHGNQRRLPRFKVLSPEVRMAHDHAPDEFTDEEFGFLRHARFGELPPRPQPENLVESVETDPGRDLPDLDPKPYNIIRGSAG